jgi:hypothetical protein
MEALLRILLDAKLCRYQNVGVIKFQMLAKYFVSSRIIINFNCVTSERIYYLKSI